MADKTWSSLNKGAYSALTAYTIGDFVSYQGGYYTCIANTTGNAPTAGSDNSYWKLVASKGDTGATGTAATIEVGTVTTLNPGESATVTNSGSSSAATFNFGIPQGATGATGATGTSFTWKGDWSAVTAYAVRDVVYRLGSSYICIQAHTNHEPPNATYWELVAQKGVNGEGSGDVMGPASSTTNRIAAFDGVTGKLLKDGGKTIAEVEAASIPVGYLDTDGTLAANLDSKVATQKATKTYADTKMPSSYLDTDGTLAANSDTKVASQKAVKTYADTKSSADKIETLTNKSITSPTITGTPVLNADTKEVFNYLDGWIPDSDTWVYVSATSFKIAGKNVTAKFPKGTKIKLTQTSTKYFYVVASSFSTDTTVTVTGGSSYSLANATITSPNYSYLHTPQGFPIWMSYSVTWTANSGVNPSIGNGTLDGRFKIDGDHCEYEVLIIMGSTTTYGSGGVVYVVSIPLTSATSDGAIGTAWCLQFKLPYGQKIARHRGTWLEFDGLGAANYVYANAPFTFGDTDQISIKGKYRF